LPQADHLEFLILLRVKMIEQSESINRTLTEAKSRRRLQFWIQIILPVVLGAGLVIALGYFAARTTSNTQINQWSNISAVIVILPVLLSCFIGLIVLAALIFGTAKLTNILPPVLRQVQFRFYQVELAVRRAADKAAAPLIKTRSTAAGINSVFRGNGSSSS
jgi:hypothetical protein